MFAFKMSLRAPVTLLKKNKFFRGLYSKIYLAQEIHETKFFEAIHDFIYVINDNKKAQMNGL